MKARSYLREATAADHARVDALFGAYDLGDEQGYRRFLMAQAAAFLPVEAALDAADAERFIPDWPRRRRSELLKADLTELAADEPAPEITSPLRSPADILGAVYVLEGSRLGGALLKRALPQGAPRRFLEAPQSPGAWRKLLETLDEFLYEAATLDAAAASARGVFQIFEAGGLRYLESRVE